MIHSVAYKKFSNYDSFNLFTYLFIFSLYFAWQVEEASKVEVENSKTDAPVEAAPVAATIEEEKKKEVAEQK